MNAEDAHITNSIFYETKLLALKLIDVEFINLSDNQFENCNSALAVKYTFSSPFQVQISKTNFINNKASATGGAIGFFTIGQGVIEISGCLMEGNKANLGGAIYIENTEEKAILIVYNSQFINNTVRSNGLETPQTIGNGGAIFAICKEIHVINSLFKENVAVRGGAIFTESYMIMLNSKLIENVGEYSGGGLYTNNLNTLRNLNLNYFENNRNEFYGYGPQIATNAFRMDLTFKVNDELVDEIIIFPGQPFTVSLQLQDFVGNNITTLPVGPEFGFPTYEDGFVVKPLYTNDFFIYEFTVLQSPNFTLTEDTVFISQNIMVYQQATTYFNITIIDCPSDYERLMNENDLLYCQLKVFPLQSIIIIVVCVASVFFIIGIGFGILFIYCCVNITSKLRKLKKKEKAELEIEKRIIDKKIVFGNSDYNDDNEYYNDDNVSLLKDFKKKKSKTKASFSIPIEEILLEKKIGEGGCGTVYCAKWGENLVAIKSIKILDDDDDDNTQNEDFEREVSLLSSLRHPNIVSFYGVTITEKTKYMVIEYLSKGSLKQVIYYSKIGKEILTLKKKLNILIGISQGMNYLHNLKPNPIIHRDLKPENVLLDENDICKVCDFGLSKIIGNTSQTMTTNVGTLFYLSPEMLKGDNPSKITSKLDVYSFSIIMWELLFEESPYSHNSSNNNNHTPNKMNYFSSNNSNSTNTTPNSTTSTTTTTTTSMSITTNTNSSDSSKLLMSNKLEKQSFSIDNIFLIPSLVVKGLRPFIPFSNDKEKEIWIKEFIYPFENVKQIEYGNILIYFDKYLNLMKNCWKENPEERPNFNEILLELNEMKKLFNC